MLDIGLVLPKIGLSRSLYEHPPAFLMLYLNMHMNLVVIHPDDWGQRPYERCSWT